MRRRRDSGDVVLVPVHFNQLRMADWLSEDELARENAFEFEKYLLARDRQAKALDRWAAEHGRTATDVIHCTRWNEPSGGPGRMYSTPRWRRR